ncbi:MAG TPA: TonB family protein [Rhizomicrobium sp.]|jgi:TonB family protein|nr:TonB family protein [Rhizomicrobium sp.]
MKKLAILAIAACMGLVPAAALGADVACTMPNQPIPSPVMATHSIPPYPTYSVVAGEQGTTDVNVTVGTGGAPTAIALINSSGSKRLDDATIQYVTANYKWLPAIKDCLPQAAVVHLRIAWSLPANFNYPPGTLVINPNIRDYPPDSLSRGEHGVTAILLVFANSEAQTSVLISSGSPTLDAKAQAMVQERYGKATRIGPNVALGGFTLFVKWQLPDASAK